MTCYHPLASLKLSYPDGKVKVHVLGSVESDEKLYRSYRQKEWWIDGEISIQYLELPCGQCTGCRLERSRSWAVRCVHEAQMHDENCFLTLTYDDDHLPSDGSLVKRDLTLFWKRLRKEIDPIRIRYFACGEYGSQFERPHYHACVFGWSPPDKKLYTIRSGAYLYISAMIGNLWPFGFHTIGDVTFDSAAYVARYVLKKINGDRQKDHYGKRVPEYVVMSRKPGIAHDWIEKYSSDVYPNDFVVIRDNIKCKPPRYYDKIYDEELNGDLVYLKNKRSDPRGKTIYTCDSLYRKENYKKTVIKHKLKRKYEENI